MMIVEWKDEQERKRFDAELNADPARGAVSHGVDALAALLGGLKPPRMET